MQLPIECLELSFSFLGNDLATLHCCAQVSRAWRQATVHRLYRNPWAALALPRYGKYSDGDEQRVKKLIRTLLGSSTLTLPKEELDFIQSQEIKAYSNFLPVLRAFDFRYMAPWHGDFSLTTGDKVAHKLWRLVRDQCSSVLEKLVFVELLSLTEVFPTNITYPSLQSLCLHIEDLELSHTMVIARACKSIQELRIRAHYIEDAAIAKIISAQKPQNLKELFLVCDRGIRSISDTIDALIKHHQYSCTELRFGFQSCGLFFTQANKDAILRISELPNLRVLELSCCKCVDDQCIAEIASKCHLLEEIDLSATSVTATGIINMVKKLGLNLKRIILSQNSNHIVEAVLPAISKYCPQLQHLDIRGLPYTLSDMKCISNLKRLKTLVLGNCREPSEVAAEEMLCQLITECQSLCSLEFGRVVVTESVVHAVANHKILQLVKMNMNTLKLAQTSAELIMRPKTVFFTPF
ncbi:RNI-like protein [Basidiobolus meristosporus CBS 931.73]|uniref:RNI-like protein n=1 Tax=Basidiobolus meristosporus CBS 931.73 TaxID=1314790 RepID=A0A1Y1Y6W7_9FUNG|nr:RNI-like protein [Basidiobolus meristosporus CBS 931.73]|eukprot:ORX93324.1 RNI-like protein [Basidiobolus meristosporus CBS 931.73]